MTPEAPTPEKQKTDETPFAPTVSFSHLIDATGDGPPLTEEDPAYGFPASREEGLYETGVLMRTFLKC